MTQQLLRFEVPRVAVDLESDDLPSTHKRTVLAYVGLEAAIERIGVQSFERSTQEHISLDPVRTWLLENAAETFSYDFAKRNIPITFRSSLALAVLGSRISEHLSEISPIDVYASHAVEKAYAQHDVSGLESRALQKVNYAALPVPLQRDLILHLIDNLASAQAISRAHLLFPDGVDKSAVLMSDYGLIFDLMGYDNDRISFDEIWDLSIQGKAARACIRDYVRILTVQDLLGEAERRPQEPNETYDREARDQQLIDEGSHVRCDFCGDLELRLAFPEGATFFDIFPFKEGETPDDVLRAFKRISSAKGLVRGHAEDFEQYTIQLRSDGSVTGFYVYDYFGDEGNSCQVDMLTPHEEKYHEHLRRTNLTDLLKELRREIDGNEEVIRQARTKYDRTFFTVEKGFMIALTGNRYDEATKAERDLENQLVAQARETVDGKGGHDHVLEEPTSLVPLSGAPVDHQTIETDYLILRSIRDNYRFDLADLVAIGLGRTVDLDNIRTWFGSVSALLSQFEGIMSDTDAAFSILGIEPTNNVGDIQQAYRRISKQTHPDRVLGLPPEDQVVAVDRFMNATEAYRTILDGERHNVSRKSPAYFLGRIGELLNGET